MGPRGYVSSVSTSCTNCSFARSSIASRVLRAMHSILFISPAVLFGSDELGRIYCPSTLSFDFLFQIQLFDICWRSRHEPQTTKDCCGTIYFYILHTASALNISIDEFIKYSSTQQSFNSQFMCRPNDMVEYHRCTALFAVFKLIINKLNGSLSSARRGTFFSLVRHFGSTNCALRTHVVRAAKVYQNN